MEIEPSDNLGIKKIEVGQEVLEIIPLGGGREVGRSCIIIRFREKLIMLDCGIHPASNDLSALPFFDLINPSDVDVCLITHFHLDHCGAVPYFTEKTNFGGRVFMTHPTKAIYKMVLSDSLKVAVDELCLYDRKDITKSMEKIDVINFHEEVEHKGIKFTCYSAGHVLGACMFLINIAGTKILYTGDYSREEDRHIKPAEIPPEKVDILIVESTYGIKCHDPREVREKMFLETVHKIIKRNGNVLLPVFVLGRAQELLLMLDEYWSKNPSLEDVPIYYASALMAKCMIIFQTYINMMGKSVREAFKRGINPFNFKNISILKNIDNIDDNDPSVVMASPGMLQKGLSRALFERWCHSDKNGVIFTGYCVETTLAREVLNGKKEVKTQDGSEIPIKMSVDYVTFCAHADFEQTKDYILSVSPKQIVLVHGEKHEAKRLKKELDVVFPQITTHAPKNWQVVEIIVDTKKTCVLEGKLVKKLDKKLKDLKAKKKKKEQERRKKQKSKRRKKLEKEEDEIEEDLFLSVNVEGMLVKKNYDYYLLDKEEINEYIGREPTFINQVLRVPFHGSLDLAYFFIAQIYPSSTVNKFEDRVKGGKEGVDNEEDFISINNEEIKIVKNDKKNFLVFCWVSGEKNDIIADCLALMFSQFPKDPSYDIFYEESREGEDEELKRIRQKVCRMVLSVFEKATFKIDGSNLIFDVKGEKNVKVKVDMETGKIYSDVGSLRHRFEGLLQGVLSRR